VMMELVLSNTLLILVHINASLELVLLDIVLDL